LGNTTTFNGNAGSAFMGGVLASTIIITEYAL
jgi:UDP-N-acetylmuramyl pentapeptide phosphotransferase/UDP-N-acetylglucosamine-1-phosphate transferase